MMAMRMRRTCVRSAALQMTCAEASVVEERAEEAYSRGKAHEHEHRHEAEEAFVDVERLELERPPRADHAADEHRRQEREEDDGEHESTRPRAHGHRAEQSADDGEGEGAHREQAEERAE